MGTFLIMIGIIFILVPFPYLVGRPWSGEVEFVECWNMGLQRILSIVLVGFVFYLLYVIAVNIKNFI